MADWLTQEQRSFNMASIRSKGTKPEERLGALLREMFPRHKLVAHPGDLVGKPDYILPGLSLVVFADGCFWHGCPKHGRNPEDNSDYWGPKLQRNKARDRRVARDLRASGYVVVRVWDHELRGQMSEARTKVRRALRKAG
jgi:DNA mismatch endonuclease (patch repair protein)